MSDHPSQESLGERIRRLRKERKFSITKMAEEIGITKSWLSRVELDQETPSSVLLNKIALFLKVPIRELLQDMEEQMELESRMKLVEVLLESNQADEAEGIIAGLQRHEELREGDEIRLTVLLGECRNKQKRYDEALGTLLPLITKLESANHHDAHTLAWIRYELGVAYYSKKDFTNAFYNYQKAHDYTIRFEKFDSLAAKIYYYLAIVLMNKGKSNDAIYYLEKCSAYCQSTDDLKHLSKVLYEQGLAFKNIKDYSRAIQAFEHAKAIMHSHNMNYFAAVVQHTIASEITVHDDPHLAVDQLHKCLTTFKESESYALLILVYSRMSTIYIGLKDHERALLSLQEANRLIFDHNLPEYLPQIGEFYRVFAAYHYANKNYHDAISFASKSSELFGKIGLVKDQINALRLITDSYQQLGEFEVALTTERQRCELYDTLQNRGDL